MVKFFTEVLDGKMVPPGRRPRPQLLAVNADTQSMTSEVPYSSMSVTQLNRLLGTGTSPGPPMPQIDEGKSYGSTSRRRVSKQASGHSIASGSKISQIGKKM
jgi:hypothetical protein